MTKLKCDKCNNNIPENSKFCSNCGDPVSDADKVENQSSQQETIKLVCPKCEKQNLYEADISNQRININCSSCKALFKAQIATIRSKKSRGSKKDSTRTFNIRIKDFAGNEHLIEFENAEYDDFELKSKDLAAFNYFNGELRIVQNMTVNQYMKISKPGCFIASCVYGSNSREVSILREWRDQKLLISPFGVIIVNIYYAISPIIVKFLGRQKTFIKFIKFLLNKVVRSVNKKIKSF